MFRKAGRFLRSCLKVKLAIFCCSALTSHFFCTCLPLSKFFFYTPPLVLPPMSFIFLLLVQLFPEVCGKESFKTAMPFNLTSILPHGGFREDALRQLVFRHFYNRHRNVRLFIGNCYKHNKYIKTRVDPNSMILFLENCIHFRRFRKYQ